MNNQKSTHAIDAVKNAKKWKEARFIYKCLHKMSNRTGSMENCLSRLSTRDYHIGKYVFVQAIIAEFRITERSLKLDEHLLHFYNCFPYAKENKVDWRLILCTYLSLVFSATLYENPQQVLIHFFNIFGSKLSKSSNTGGRGSCNEENNTLVSIQRNDLLKLVSIAAITEKDFYDTYVCLDTIIPKEMNLIKKSNLLESLQMKPKILQKFKDQIFAQLHDETRLSILKKKEQISFARFEKEVNKIRLQHVVQNWKNEMLTYTFIKWKKYKEMKIREKWIHCWLACWSIKLHLKKWKRYTEVSASHQYHLRRLEIKRTQNQIKRIFQKWARFVNLSKKLIRVYKFDQQCKIVNSGLRKLLHTWLRWRSRRFLYHWCYMARIKVLNEVSHDFNIKRKLNSVIHAFQQNVVQNALKRKHEIEAVNQQSWLINEMNEIDCEIKSVKKLEDETIKKERQQEEIMSVQRKLAESHAKESLICSIEKEQVRKIIQAKKLTNLVLWERKWSRKKKDMEKLTLQKINKWLKSNDAKEVILKKIKVIQRECSLIDEEINDNRNDSSNNKSEIFLRSQANICLSILDGKLFHKGFIRKDFISKLLSIACGDKDNSENKVIISIDNFTKAVQSLLDGDFDGTFIKKLFNEIGEGRRKDQISLHTIQARFECTNEYNGVEGSPWKKYISPAHDIMMLHNVVSEQKYFDYEVSKKQLRAIVLDDCRSSAIVKERTEILKMRCDAYDLQSKINAAGIIQRRFHKRRNARMGMKTRGLHKNFSKVVTN